MRFVSLSSVLLASAFASGLAHAQSWDQLVAQRWPGDAILKVTESQFEVFMNEHLAQLGDKSAATRAFLTAQHLAYGYPATGELWFVNRDLPVVLPESTNDAAVAETAEPNNAPGAGGTPMLFGCGDEGTGAVDVTGDEDWWGFYISAPTHVKLFTSRGHATTGYLTDTIIDLYDAGGTLIASDDDGGPGLYSYLERNMTQGLYYVSVRGFSSNVGSYAVDLYCNVAVPPVPSFTEVEPNDTDLQANGAQIPSIALGGIAPAGDVDYWSISVTGATAISALTSAGASPVLSDTTLTLYDNVGTQLAFDDDGGPSLYSLINYTLPSAGTYYLAVRAFGSGTGNYKLAITTPSTSIVATYATSLAGCAGTNGTPTMRARFAEVPHFNSTFSVDIDDMPANAAAVGNLGFTQVLPGPIPLPLDLAIIGAPGCLLACDIGGSFPLVVDGAGATVWHLYIPLDANLIGLTFYQQAFNIDVGANSLGVTSSNLGTGVIGDAVQ